MELEYPTETIDKIAGHIEEIVRLLGEDPSREGLLKTPQRAAKALYYATLRRRLLATLCSQHRRLTL